VLNIKWGVTAGIIAALVSMVLGVVFGVSMFYILVRAVVFLFVFFALGTGFHVIVNNFFPELLYIDDGTDSKISFDQPPSGSQINITLGGIGEYAVPEMYKDSGDPQELGNIEDLISGHFKTRSSYDSGDSDEADTQEYAPEPAPKGVDLRTEDDYNTKGEDFSVNSFRPMPQEFESYREAEPEPAQPVTYDKPAFTPVFGGDDLGALPDLGSMATAFSTGFEAEEAAAMPHMGVEEADSSQTYNKGNKPQPLEGDFLPQQLAEGIRTVLKKD
jgi:hypothetical protein